MSHLWQELCKDDTFYCNKMFVLSGSTKRSTNFKVLFNDVLFLLNIFDGKKSKFHKYFDVTKCVKNNSEVKQKKNISINYDSSSTIV